MKKVIPSLLLFFIISGICFAEPKLESYLINDLELKRLLLEYQKANLAAKKNDVDNGVAIELSSGTARFQFNDGGTNSSVTPTVTISVPKASNLSLKASSPSKTLGLYGITLCPSFNPKYLIISSKTIL